MQSFVFIAAAGIGCLAIGILVGRYYVPDDRALKRTAKNARRYMSAVNHLLARDRDAAADELLAVVDENISDLEPYFALASLFRSRGEWERAIRVHQAIELRAADDKDVRLRALYELGLDFRAAGMPRRATKALEECLGVDGKHTGALRALCGLYEEQGRYVESAKAWARLSQIDKSRSPREPHLWAAAAQVAMAAGDLGGAHDYMKKGRSLSDDNAHLAVVAADIAAQKGDFPQAIAEIEAAVRIESSLVRYLVPGLVNACAAKLGEAPHELSAERGAAEVLSGLISDVGEPEWVALAIADLESEFDAEAALSSYREIAAGVPDSLPARVAAARIALSEEDADAVRDELKKLVGKNGALAFVRDGAWRCTSCQHRFSDFFWRCRECRHWGGAVADSGQPVTIRGRRDRRQRPRTVDGALVGNAGLPSRDIGYDDDAGPASEGSMSRARGWISEAWGSLRGKRDS